MSRPHRRHILALGLAVGLAATATPAAAQGYAPLAGSSPADTSTDGLAFPSGRAPQSRLLVPGEPPPLKPPPVAAPRPTAPKKPAPPVARAETPPPKPPQAVTPASAPAAPTPLPLVPAAPEPVQAPAPVVETAAPVAVGVTAPPLPQSEPTVAADTPVPAPLPVTTQAPVATGTEDTAPGAEIPQQAALPTAAEAVIPVAFAPGQAEPAQDIGSLVAGLTSRLDTNAAARVRLNAYAPGAPEEESQSRRLSLARALAIRGRLVDAGIASTRIEVRALGNKVSDGSADRVDVIVLER